MIRNKVGENTSRIQFEKVTGLNYNETFKKAAILALDEDLPNIVVGPPQVNEFNVRDGYPKLFAKLLDVVENVKDKGLKASFAGTLENIIRIQAENKAGTVENSTLSAELMNTVGLLTARYREECKKVHSDSTIDLDSANKTLSTFFKDFQAKIVEVKELHSKGVNTELKERGIV